MAGGRPAKYNTAEELEKAIEAYFIPPEVKTTKTKEGVIQSEGTKELDKPTITGLALHLGFESRQSFYDYEKDGEFSYIIKRARLKIESRYEQNLHSQACTGAIFALKNFGWKDKQEIEHSGNPEAPVYFKLDERFLNDSGT